MESMRKYHTSAIGSLPGPERKVKMTEVTEALAGSKDMKDTDDEASAITQPATI